MLVPRESDIPALFLVFILLPLVSYFILGKWSETSKRKERLSLIASEAAEEPLRVNDMAVGSVMPIMHMPNTNSGIRQCARCFASATTRCSQCKAVWYCSGRCQIVHWRHVHKLECQQLGSSPKHLSIEGSLGGVSHAETMDQCTFKYDNALSADVVSQRSAGIDTLLTSHRDSSEGEAGTGFTQPPEDAYVREGDFSLSEHRANSPRVSKNGDNDLRGALHENDVAERECLSAFDGGNSREILNLSTTAMSGTNETKGLNCSSERTSTMISSKSRIASQSNGIDLHNSPKSRMKTSKEPLSSDTEIISVQTAKESRIATLKDDTPLQENNNLGLMKVTKSTKVDNHQQSEDSTIRKRKMIFPYEEFVKYFQYEAFNVAPRGLVNCGNSCYANAVLQCLACTKPLIIYLLRQSHSKAGCSKDWCLVCELEQLVLSHFPLEKNQRLFVTNQEEKRKTEDRF